MSASTGHAPDPVRIPPPEHQMPTCPLCLDDCTHDECLTCDSCGVYWPDGDTAPGRRIEEFDQPACGAEHRPWANRTGLETIAEYRYHCVLDADHEGDHRGVRCDVAYASEDVQIWARTEAEAEGPAVVTADPAVSSRPGRPLLVAGGVVTVATTGGVL